VALLNAERTKAHKNGPETDVLISQRARAETRLTGPSLIPNPC